MTDIAESVERDDVALLKLQIDKLTEEIVRRQRVEDGLREEIERQRAMASAELFVQQARLETRFARFMQHLPGLAWIKDHEGRYVYANDAAIRAFQREREELYGRTDDAVFSPTTAAEFKQNDRCALASGAGVQVVERLKHPDGVVHYSLVSKFPIPDHDSQPPLVGGMAIDITERKRAEDDARFLADASAALAGLVDYKSTLQNVARLAVPTFADWCTIDMLATDGKLERLAVAHVDPAKVELAQELHQRYPRVPAMSQAVAHVIRTGQSAITPEITDEMLVASTTDAEFLRVLRELSLKSYIGVPVKLREKVLGVVTFISAESARRYDATDLAVAEDLAHRAAVAIDNAHLYQALREADQRKNEFLALLGHELRNPLAPISNSLQLLKMPSVDATIAGRARDVICRQVEHLVRLVDDLLDVSRIMRGRIELRREPVELAVVMARAVETSQPLLDEHGHRLAISVAAEPLVVNGDLVRLAQVVSNLLNNAAKYTERGGQVWLTACREQDTAVLRVRDTGVGIDAEALPRLFDMFYQAERRTKESQGGLGIGLSLVRGVVELHGGSVEAHSSGVGLGSEFLVRLPLAARIDTKGGKASDLVDETKVNPPTRRLLVVDDNVDAADVLVLLLRLHGHDAHVAYDGHSALAKAEDAPPDIAFLDLDMPNMNGYELAKAFRSNPVFCGTMLVALTGWGQPEDRQRTAEAGFDHHLVKPVDAATLRKLLEENAHNCKLRLSSRSS